MQSLIKYLRRKQCSRHDCERSEQRGCISRQYPGMRFDFDQPSSSPLVTSEDALCEQNSPILTMKLYQPSKSFYDFLTTLPGLPRSAMQEAPPNGWPEIDSTTIAPLKKNKAAINLLRHIPYIDNSHCGGTVEIAYKTISLDFNVPAGKTPIDFGNLEGNCIPVGCELPEHVDA